MGKKGRNSSDLRFLVIVVLLHVCIGAMIVYFNIEVPLGSPGDFFGHKQPPNFFRELFSSK